MKRLLISIAAIALLSGTALGWAPKGNNIKTRWAAEVSPENARTEYPRPQMVRKDWKSLNGLWNYAVTPKDAAEMGAPEGEILVPYCIESSLSGVCRRMQKDEILWYKTTIEAPQKWNGSRIILNFDAVDWQADVFVNGTLLGTHTGGFTAFSYDVTEFVKNGPAELIVKVFDPSDDEEYSIPHGKQHFEPKGIYYTPVTGIWQSVWMEAVPEARILDYNVASNPEGKLEVSVNVEGEADEIKVEILCPKVGYNPEKPACGFFKKGKAKVSPGETASLKIRRPKFWTPDKPWLYGLRIKLYKGGKLIDKIDGYTAIRSIGEKSDANGVKRLALNGDILFQYGPLDQGWWPDGLYTAPTAEAMAWDIEQTKALGFNMIRKHVKVEPSRWYYDCDRLGIMVWQDMPCIGRYEHDDWAQGIGQYGAGRDYYAQTEAIRANYYKEWGEIISLLKKFQSIVVWVPFNEAWGQFDTKQVCEWTKAQDPTRLINAASGGNWTKGAGEILDSHYYPRPAMRIVDPEMINVLGEYGGIGRPVEGHTWEIGRKWGYVQFDTEEKVTDTYCLYSRDLIDLKQNTMCAAAVYTQTTDCEGEVNGFFTYDREILKCNLERVREANLAVINAPDTPAQKLVSSYAFHHKDPNGGRSRDYGLYAIRGGGLTMQVTEFGARVISLFAPDKNGKYDDIIVGYNDIDRYLNNTGERFLGATVGRVANRIARGELPIDGKIYKLPKNNNGQTLHGGLEGIDMVKWKVLERTPNSIKLGLKSKDGADGFPGNLDIELTYALTDEGALDIAYKATTDAPTAVNLSNHAFYNLKGSQGGTILDHMMTIPASGITPVDEVLIPTGEILPVEGTPFDFREPHAIGERIGESHPQLGFGGGYDHNWVLDVPSDGELHKVCTLSESTTGRVLEIFSDQPGLQFYSGNFFDGSYCGKTDKPIGWREALALETQKFPDAVHHENFPSTILRPGEIYTQHTVYKFSTR